MVKQTSQLDTVFQALSDPTRREMLLRIASSPESTVSELAQPYSMSLPAISKHIKVLESAHIIMRTKSGKEVTFSFNPAPLKTILVYLSFYTDYLTPKK